MNTSAHAAVRAGSPADPFPDQAIDCLHFVAGTPPSAGDNYVEEGSCDISGSPVRIVTFSTDGRRDSYRRTSAESTAHLAGSSYWIALSPELVDSVGSKIKAPVRAVGCC